MSAQSILNSEETLTHVFLIRFELKLTSRLQSEMAKESANVPSIGDALALELKSIALWVIEHLKPIDSKGVALELQNVVCRHDLERLQCLIYLSLCEPKVIVDGFMPELSECIGMALEQSSFKPLRALQDEQAEGFGLSRLSQLSDLPGPSHLLKPHVHYVVETDVESGWWNEINDWYAQEHLPGLASVPGCVMAKRYVNLDAGPRSFACYDLLTQDVLLSPEWLAVRATPWSSKARPHFLNTKRDVFPLVL